MKRSARPFILIAVVALLVVAYAFTTGCAKKEEAPKGVAPVPNTPPASLDDGEALVKQECSVCHSVDTVYAKKGGDVKEWERTVRRMVEQYGASVTDEEATAISEYLGNR